MFYMCVPTCPARSLLPQTRKFTVPDPQAMTLAQPEWNALTLSLIHRVNKLNKLIVNSPSCYVSPKTLLEKNVLDKVEIVIDTYSTL